MEFAAFRKPQRYSNDEIIRCGGETSEKAAKPLALEHGSTGLKRLTPQGTGDLLTGRKNLQRGEDGLGNFASSASGRVLSAGDARGEEIITCWGGDAADKPAKGRDIFLRVATSSGFATENRFTGSRERHDVEHRVHGLVGEGQLARV